MKERTQQAIKEIIEYFKNNEDLFNECIEELDNYNGYLSDNRIYNMEDLPEFVDLSDFWGFMNRVYFGDDMDDWHMVGDRKVCNSFNPNRNYFFYNGCGNLCSTNYKDYSSELNDYVVQAMADNRRFILSIDDNLELAELFDKLEEIECEE